MEVLLTFLSTSNWNSDLLKTERGLIRPSTFVDHMRNQEQIVTDTKMSQQGKKIEKREDVNPEEGIRKYGDVAFADPVNKKYPLDTEAHVRAAHNYINHPDNAAKYSADEVKTIKSRINQAAKKYGIEIKND